LTSSASRAASHSCRDESDIAGIGLQKQAIHRGSFPSVRDLMIKIRAFINGWNDRCHPFVWTKTADQVLDKVKRKKNSLTPH
jgi:hypothetical protein